MRALLIALIMLPASAAHATPIYYEAVFDIFSTHGSAPADWGAVTVGTSAYLQFGYDPDLVTNPSNPGWPAGTFTYVMNVGDATIFGGPIEQFRTAGSASLFLNDFIPRVCTPPDPCAGGFGDWFVDDLSFNFGCADWAGAPQLLPNFDCASPMTGTTFFELFRTSQQPQDFGIAASLSSLTRVDVPEPGGLALIAVGLAGLWITRRRTPRLKADAGR